MGYPVPTDVEKVAIHLHSLNKLYTQFIQGIRMHSALNGYYSPPVDIFSHTPAHHVSRQDGTVASTATVTVAGRLRCHQGRDFSFSLSVTRLVIIPTLTLNDPLSQNFTTKWHGHFKRTDSGNGKVYANYHR